MDQVYLSPPEAAKYTGFSESYLAKLRMDSNRASGPTFLRIGPRSIRYRRKDLDKWMNVRVFATEVES